MAKPERYQMAFDFRPQPGLSSVRYALSGEWQGMTQQEDGAGRFTRVVKEEVVVCTPAEAAEHLLTHVYAPFEHCNQEELWVLLMNRKQRITHEVMVYRGMVNRIHVRIAELFKDAVRVNAPAILLSHCHPSGDSRPSEEDQQVNELAIQAGNLLGIEVVDHVLIGDDCWFSMRQAGVGGFPLLSRPA
jgi:DNA repair protein RadC